MLLKNAAAVLSTGHKGRTMGTMGHFDVDQQALPLAVTRRPQAPFSEEIPVHEFCLIIYPLISLYYSDRSREKACGSPVRVAETTSNL